MPTNSNYDGFFAGIGGIPLFTYGMITVTTIVLAYMTIMEPDEVVEEVIDSTVSNSSFMTNMTAPLPENIYPLDQQIPEEAIAPSEEAVAPSEEAIAPSEEAIAPSEEAVAPSEEAIAPSAEAVAEEMEEPPVENKGGKKRRRTRKQRKQL